MPLARGAGLDTSAPFAVIKDRYLGIADQLGVTGAWEWLREVQQQIAAGAEKDWVASRGEYLSARIIAAFLEAEFVDAADGIRFGADGRFHPGESYGRLGARLAKTHNSLAPAPAAAKNSAGKTPEIKNESSYEWTSP